MAKKKKRSHESNAPAKSASHAPPPSAESSASGVAEAAAGPAQAAPAQPQAPAEQRKASPAASSGAGSAPANKFDADAHDRFATSFKPAWQVAKGGAPASPSEVARREQALSGEISLDAIPLPPLPTERPKRQAIAAVVVLLLIVGAGIIASRSTSESPPAPPARSDAP